MASLGAMTMPADFTYKRVYLRGRPVHQKNDTFWRKHPPMDPRRWAKIFAPFDALDGFDEAVSSKEVLYCERRELSEGEKMELDRKFLLLHSLTCNSKKARSNRPSVTVTFFAPCQDPNSEWYETGGRYERVSGIVRKVDVVNQVLVLENSCITISEISDVTLIDGPTA